jgi:hypothetical protein
MTDTSGRSRQREIPELIVLLEKGASRKEVNPYTWKSDDLAAVTPGRTGSLQLTTRSRTGSTS